ncbi:MAG: NADP transhydrogenase subunit alpha, partial [Candidatus Omnitrophica bacterium]|nr:NADP transhydrogenase subunit alpha [Candidatus Omnitrophota bacterium]
IRFFKNHGFLGLDTHYQWRTPEGGSRQYRDKLMNAFNNTVHINNGAKEIFEEEQNVVVIDTRGERHEFDKVLIAAHADDALKMLKKPTDLQRNLLSKFRYQPNRATLHTDKKLMPKTRRAWSSWNYRIQRDRRNKLTTTTIYDMNSLQDVSDKQNYFVSINDPGEINPLSIIWEKEYHHPLFDVSAMRAQAKLPELNREGNIYFSGSYFKYGFHEDAFTSGLNAAREIAGKVLWN